MTRSPLTSRKTSPSDRCYQKGGATGCYTTGWQDHVEIQSQLRRRLRRGERVFTARVQALFKAHARSLPSFLGEGFEHTTRSGSLELLTLCTSGSPWWDLDREGDYESRKQCNVYTLLSKV